MQDLLPELCDLYPEQVKLLDPIFTLYGAKPLFWGQVVTVKCWQDNSRVKELLATPGEGKVLVVDGGGSVERALMGDLIADSAYVQGWAGVVINGAIRDVSAINTMDLGVRALAACPMKTERKGLGELNCSIELAGQEIKPGMFVYADENGVLVSEQALELPEGFA
ncbi:putative 4-hydroxy-4-methyl-2-oxoglutarate aldolase [Agarivorans sp. 1_MG-2023]|uniref:putative 4-hydroxy-4-methyl-2-oxoglutarate aldolase n=1 Tax=Agarivorans sp. 1_MG-2023 TaxID=3062634 RepID=UPI0026E429C6|nr:putative 4-hydroxy-4-methyl-2-oxoglutarate aldolase [Agarivorans sp. 1_MG-2023]MDO6764494.1 putative 4-hydroxy-4-methyl-2-oxoglutarate aldolase [Agarivorans sp. 1_MG-2023]